MIFLSIRDGIVMAPQYGLRAGSTDWLSYLMFFLFWTLQSTFFCYESRKITKEASRQRVTHIVISLAGCPRPMYLMLRKLLNK